MSGQPPASTELKEIPAKASDKEKESGDQPTTSAARETPAENPPSTSPPKDSSNPSEVVTTTENKIAKPATPEKEKPSPKIQASSQEIALSIRLPPQPAYIMKISPPSPTPPPVVVEVQTRTSEVIQARTSEVLQTRTSEGGEFPPLETNPSTSSMDTLRSASIFSTHLPPQEKKLPNISSADLFRRHFSSAQTMSNVGLKSSFLEDDISPTEPLSRNKFVITPAEMEGELPRSPAASRMYAERANAHRYALRASASKVLDKEAELKKRKDGRCKLACYQISLAYSSLGIVFGDVGTSPLYTFSSIFLTPPKGEDVLGALSLIIWTILIIVALKYVTFMLLANDKGEGGPFAMFSLLSRSLKKRFHGTAELEWVTYLFEIMACVGVACVLSDGVLTPSISVLGAVQGLEVAAEVSTEVVVGVSIAIVLLLFLIQQLGTARVAFLFSPFMIIWFASLFSIGVYNICHAPEVLTAFNPAVGFKFFLRHGYAGWETLGAVFLCVTGTEATFADMGHFTGTAIRISALSVVVPSLLACYCGQAARLLVEPAFISNTFFHTLPAPVFYPMLILSFFAAITSSQAIISATFSLISQAIQLDMFPKLTLKHTDKHHIGQVYVPEINYFYMVAVVCVIAAYRNATALGNAYGIAVAAAMFIDTFFYASLIYVTFGHTWLLSVCFFLFFALVDVSFLSSNLLKFPLGGWFAVTLTLIVSMVLLVWHWGRRRMVATRKSMFTEHFDTFFRQDNPAMKNLTVLKHGLCICYSSSVDCVAPAYVHYLTCMPCLPRYTVFVHIRSMKEAFVAREIMVETIPCDNPELKIYRCVIDNGYKQESPNAEFLAEAIVRRLDKGATHFFLVSQDHVSAPPGSGIVHCFFVRCFELLLGISRTEIKDFDFPPERCLEIGITIPIATKVEKGPG